jgi:hypothetical protein
MTKWIIIASLAILTGLISCNNDDKLIGIIAVESEFETTDENWEGGFAGYDSTAVDSIMALSFSRARLPGVLDSTRYGLRTASNNTGSNMFMFAKKLVTGLRPGATYTIVIDMTIGTQYSDAATVASTTFIKAGASIAEPIVTRIDGKYIFNLNKGIAAEGGTEMVTLGNIANGQETNGYRLVSRSNGNNPIRVTASPKGEIWLCVGTDSSFKGATILYYERIKAILTLQN